MATYAAVSYGSYEWGCMFAIRLANMLRRVSATARVALITDDGHVGGYTGGGLANWDIGSPSKRLRGTYRQLYRRCGFASALRGSRSVDPAIAERVFLQMLAEAGVDVIRDFRLGSVAKVGGAGSALTTLTAIDGRTVTASIFFDGHNCMDLVQKTSAKGVGWTIGRESRTAYDEQRAGWGNDQRITGFVTPYATDGSLRPGVSPIPQYAVGDAYPGVAAYAFRTVYTSNANDMVPFFAGEVDGIAVGAPGSWYNREDYALHAARYSPASSFIGGGCGPGQSGSSDNVVLTDPVTHQPLHWGYAEGDAAYRAAYDKALLKFTIGWNYFCATDPAWAGRWQTEMQTRGYPKSQFKAHSNVAWAIYTRETVRPIGAYVMSSKDLTVTDTAAARNVFKANSVAVGGYSIDTKSTINIPSADGLRVVREGGTTGTDIVYRQGYAIPATSMFNPAICPNLLHVPSTTSIAWGSVRIVINLCIAAEAAAFMAFEYIVNGTPLAAINYVALRSKIQSVGLYVDPFPVGVDPDEPIDDGDMGGEVPGGGG